MVGVQRLSEAFSKGVLNNFNFCLSLFMALFSLSYAG
jgi:hypothetical protein